MEKRGVPLHRSLALKLWSLCGHDRYGQPEDSIEHYQRAARILDEMGAPDIDMVNMVSR